MKAILLILCTAALITGCTGSAVFIKPTGDRATVVLHDYHFVSYDVELLALSDSMLMVESGGSLSQIPFSKLEGVQVEGYRTPVAPKALSLATPLVFELIILGAAGSVHQTGWQVASVAAMATTGWLMFSGDPQSYFGTPLKAREIETLKLYCRYPQGLTIPQRRALLAARGQQEFLILGSRSSKK